MKANTYFKINDKNIFFEYNPERHNPFCASITQFGLDLIKLTARLISFEYIWSYNLETHSVISIPDISIETTRSINTKNNLTFAIDQSFRQN